MAAISEAKRAANRENAKKSTGPRTDEGKERSRANALKHGLSGAGIVRAEAVEEDAQRRVEEWSRALGPKTEPERWLVERAAVDSARVDAAVRCERGRRAAALRKDGIESRAEELAALKAEALGERLMAGGSDPRGIRRRLRSTSAGCSWMIARWEAIARRAERLRGWDATDFDAAERLMGGGGTIGPRLARMAIDFLAQLEERWEMGKNPSQVSTGRTFAALRERLALSGWFPGFPTTSADSIARAREGLRALVAEEIAELTALRDRLVEIEAVDASEASDRSCVDLSPKGRLLHRYEMDLQRRVFRCLRELDRLQAERAETADADINEPAVSPESVPRNEPTAAPKPLPAAELPQPPSRLPSPFRLDGPESPPPLPIRMVPAASHARR